MATVTVVIPAYNAASYLGLTIDSLRAQSFSDWELVVIDDGSEDETLGIARGYELTDSRVRVVSKRNGGVSSARNRGIREAATGNAPYITFLDADDVLENDALELLLREIQPNPTWVGVHGLARFIGPTGETIRDGQLERSMRSRLAVRGRRVVSLSAEDPTDFSALMVRCWIHTPGVLLLRRRWVEELGPRPFEEDDRLIVSRATEDWDFYVRVARFGAIGYVDQVVLNYRLHPQQATGALAAGFVEGVVWRRMLAWQHESDSESNRSLLERGFRPVMLYSGKEKLRGASQLAKRRQFRPAAQELARATKRFYFAGLGRP